MLRSQPFQSLVVYLSIAGSTALTACQGSAANRDHVRRFEVLVIGSLHAPWQFRSERFTPAHIRAAIQLAEPDVLGVESNATWFAHGRFHEVTYEAQEIAVPYGKAHSIPVYGVDYMDVERWESEQHEHWRQRWTMIEQSLSAHVLPLQMFGEVMPSQRKRTQEYFSNPDFDFRVLNNIVGNEDKPLSLPWNSDDPNFGGERNRRIVENCLQVMANHPDKRLVVVIGAGHKAVLDVLFGRIEGVCVLRFSEDVPIPEERNLRGGWTTQDLIVTLGHNLDGERSYFHPELVDLPRMRRLVAELDAHGTHSNLAEYFRGRILFMSGDLDSAALRFDEIIDSIPEAELYPFPMNHWRMCYTFQQTVRIEKARILLALHKDKEAADILSSIEIEIVGEDNSLSNRVGRILAREFPNSLLKDAGETRPTSVQQP